MQGGGGVLRQWCHSSPSSGLESPSLCSSLSLRISNLEPGGRVSTQLVGGTQGRRVRNHDWALRFLPVSQVTTDLSLASLMPAPAAAACKQGLAGPQHLSYFDIAEVL